MIIIKLNFKAKKWFEEAAKDKNCPQALLMLSEFEEDKHKKASLYNEACKSGNTYLV